MTSVVVACDHAGLPLKDEVLSGLRDLGCQVEDYGTHGGESVDYPEFAHRASEAVAAGKFRFAVLICGSGVGMSMAANKHQGVRAVVCSEPYSAAMARRHNDANVLCMGAKVVGPGLARDILEAFLGQEFEGGRHARRVDKLEVAR